MCWLSGDSCSQHGPSFSAPRIRTNCSWSLGNFVAGAVPPQLPLFCLHPVNTLLVRHPASSALSPTDGSSNRWSQRPPGSERDSREPRLEWGSSVSGVVCEGCWARQRVSRRAECYQPDPAVQPLGPHCSANSGAQRLTRYKLCLASECNIYVVGMTH